jgi:Flp pilus assembly pilin Flp
MGTLLRRLWWGEDGQDLTEYALLLLFLALAAIASIRSLTGSIENVFKSAGNQMDLFT